nr:hypothetical protein [uncultured Chryseobacterium sp.]
MEKLLDLFESIIDTIRDNGLFIFLAILFPVLLYQVGAGEEIILNLSYQQDGKNKAFFVVASFLFLGLSIWCVPTISIYFFKFLTKISPEKIESILDKLLDLYNAKPKSSSVRKILQIPVRYLAVLPWIIFIISLINVYHGKGVMIIMGVMLFALLKILDYYTSRLTKTFDTTFLQFKRYWEIICILSILLVTYFILRINEGINYAYIIVFANIAGMMLSYIFFLIKENSEDFPEGDRRKMKMIHRKTFYMHLFLLIIAGGTMIIYYIKQVNSTIHNISPITIGTMIMSFYILIIELLFTSQILLANLFIRELGNTSLRFRLYKLVILCFVAGWIVLLFKSTNAHVITKTQVNNSSDLYLRDSLYEHFEGWYQQRKKNNNDLLEVFLVSGQGGGSRGGYWFLSNMFELDRNENFRNNLYSISTVSGSTSGAQMFLASKEYYNLANDDCRRAIPKMIYTKNYLSSALYGLLIGDFLETVAGFTGLPERDRNFYFQKEEENAFIAAHTQAGSKKTKKSPNDFFNRDYMFHYKIMKDGKYQYQYNLPLFFINTTIIENGKKAVFSPVQMNTPIKTVTVNKVKNSALFTLYEDAYGIYRKCDWSVNKEISMSACVNASQSFPLINAYSFLHGVGRLADGGLFENSGTSTTMEVYTALKKYVKLKNYRVKFTMINILNGRIDNDTAVDYAPASILNTITAMSNNPFTGHQLMAIKQLHRQSVLLSEDGGDCVITLKPTGDYNLSRILSEKTIDEMRVDLDSVKKNNSLFNKLSNKRNIMLNHSDSYLK